MPHYAHVILMGDLNIDMNVTNRNVNADRLYEFGGCLGLHLIDHNPTHHSEHHHS